MFQKYFVPPWYPVFLAVETMAGGRLDGIRFACNLLVVHSPIFFQSSAVILLGGLQVRFILFGKIISFFTIIKFGNLSVRFFEK